MNEVNSLKVGKLAKWHAAPKQPGRWGLFDCADPFKMLADVSVSPFDLKAMARVCKHPGTDGRLYDIEVAEGGMTTLEAKTWVEKHLGLPVCEDA
jgi:hypothetical protein